MEIDLNRFRAAFYEEAGEHLEDMEAGLLALESSGGDSEMLNTIFRAAHSIKGASSTFGMDQVARFTHVLENLLDRMREGEIQPTAELCELLLRSTDVLSGLINAERTESAAPADTEDVLVELQQYSSTPVNAASNAVQAVVVDASPAGRTFHLSFKPSQSFFHFGQNPLFLIDELQRLSGAFQVKGDISKLPALSDLDPEACYVGWDIELTTASAESELRDAFMFVNDDCAPVKSPPLRSQRNVAHQSPTLDSRRHRRLANVRPVVQLKRISIRSLTSWISSSEQVLWSSNAYV